MDDLQSADYSRQGKKQKPIFLTNFFFFVHLIYSFFTKRFIVGKNNGY